MEEQVSGIDDLKDFNSELEGFLSELHEKEEGYSLRLVELEVELDNARSAADSGALRLAEQEVSLSAALRETRSALSEENLRTAALVSERNDLVGRLESVSRQLDEEKARSAEKDLFISSSRSAVKDKEAEGEKVWRAMEELKTELSAERSAVKEKYAQLQTILKVRESLELKLEQAARDGARSEEGFSLKLNLVKNDLKEQAKSTSEIERKLAAAGSLLDEALEEAAHKGKLLEESRAALAEKDTLLKAANLWARELAAEAEALRGGRGRENAERAREMAAALSARVEELELELSERSSESLEKFRNLQAALNSVQSELRKKDGEMASLRGRESSFLKDIEEAEEKWKFSTAQLHNYLSKLRVAESENEINSGRIKTLEAECDKYRAAAIKAEANSSGLASREALARDGEAAGLLAALDEQAAKYTELLRKYDDLMLSREAVAREKTAASTEADSLRAYLQSMETASASAAEQEKARYEKLSEQMQNAGALLKTKEQELKEARGALAGLENECGLLRRSRLALNEKYAREIQAENELIEEAQARVLERDSELARLSAAERELKEEAEELRREKQDLLSVVRRKSVPVSSAIISEAERLLEKKEKNLNKLRAELEKARTEKAELQAREKKLREELKTRPYRAAVREAEEKLVIKEKMLAELSSLMEKLGGDFEELKQRGKSEDAPGYLPDFEELVAGVAHQVANSISIIRSHAEFCAEAPEADGARESLAVIVRNIVGLQNKIDKIMNFSRPVILQRSPELLQALVSQELERLRAAGRLDGIKAVVAAAGNLRSLSVDRVRLAAVIEQLLSNAVEAMPGGGALGINISSAGGRQRLEISDGGEGIEKKNLDSVFHPFFTTRPGKMGLGLTLARNVARAHGGTLELFSVPGSGARAVIELPET